MTIKFKQWSCKINKKMYSNKRIALELVDVNDGMPVAKATVNLPDESLKSDEAFIKDYSENEGMLDTLLKYNIIKLTGEAAMTGLELVQKVKVLI